MPRSTHWSIKRLNRLCVAICLRTFLTHSRRTYSVHPTAPWTAQQIIEAFPDDEAPRFLIRDRDSTYGKLFRERIANMGIEEVPIAYRSPWQSPFVERLIGSIRRECLDHIIVLNERHLRRILTDYFHYYHDVRPHLAVAGSKLASRTGRRIARTRQGCRDFACRRFASPISSRGLTRSRNGNDKSTAPSVRASGRNNSISAAQAARSARKAESRSSAVASSRPFGGANPDGWSFREAFSQDPVWTSASRRCKNKRLM